MTQSEPTVAQQHDPSDADRSTVGLGAGARLRRYLLGVSVVYTALTVISRSLALASGQATDTHLHLLMRLLFVMLGLGTFELIAALRQRFPQARLAVLGLVGFAILMAAVVLSVWVTGQAGLELHPDVYRDAMLNVGAVGVVLVAISAIIDVRRRRR
jgi:peptidoglycan/LPS O-acetylase OafA/YrhL